MDQTKRRIPLGRESAMRGLDDAFASREDRDPAILNTTRGCREAAGSSRQRAATRPPLEWQPRILLDFLHYEECPGLPDTWKRD